MKYLEYIQTNGTQAIEKTIDIPVGTDVEIEFWFTPLPLENASDAFHPYFYIWDGVTTSNSFSLFQYTYPSDTNLCYGFDNKTNWSSAKIPFEFNTQYHVIMNSTGVTLNDVVKATYTSTTATSQYVKLYFNRNREDNNPRRQTAKYGEFIVRQDGVETTHFYPALDNNNVPCMYDSVSQSYYYDTYNNGFVAGPVLSTIFVDTDKLTYPASGSVATISVESETNWTVSASENWVTLSATGGTSADTAITVTFPSYTGDTKRSVTLTFTNAEDTDTLTLYQKKYSAGVASEVYVADTNITELYLGDKTIENIYIGDIEVYSSGPFIGLKVSPQSVSLSNVDTAGTITVKSSEDWIISTDAQWLTLSVTGGTTGKTQVSMTATQTESDRTATITVSSSTYSATCEVSQIAINFLNFTAEQAGSTIGMNHYGTNTGTTKPVIYISTDKQTWTLWDYSTITLANVGDKVYMYGDNPNGVSHGTGNRSWFVMTGRIAANGNIQTLLTRTGEMTNVPDFGFYWLFYNCPLTTAPELPATSSGWYAYGYMFNGTLITTGPLLPMTNLNTGTYSNMFNYCRSLDRITIYATTFGQYSFKDWLANTSGFGTITCPSTLNLPSGTSGIPTGWTRVDL